MQATVLLLLTACVLQGCYSQPIIEPVLVIGRLGEMVTITCIVGAIEPSSTQIITNGSRQLTASSQTIHRDRVVFTYGPLVMSDERRRLVCRYGNVDAVGSIHVLFSARYSLENQIRSVSEGNSFTVTLVISANPQPTDGETTWSYGSAPLVDGVTGTANSLSFVNINREQSGDYTVSSTTSAGTSMDFTVTINVLYPPMYTASLSNDITCTGTSSPYTCAIREGGSGTLNCAAVGNPTPTFTIITGTNRISGNTETGEVSVSVASNADNGVVVMCTASNGEATISRQFLINVGRAPAQPKSVMATVQDDSLRVTWVYVDPNNIIPLEQFLYAVRQTGSTMVVREGSVEPTDTTLVLSLSDLQPDTLYDFELRANNSLKSSSVAVWRFATARDDAVPIASSSLLIMTLMLCLTLVLLKL